MPISAKKLAIAWCTMFVIGTDLFVVSPLLPLIADRFALPPGAAGLSVTAFAAVYMFAAPLLGQAADRLGRRRVLSFCLVGFAAANLLTAAAPSFAWLLAARVFAGVATAGVSPSIYALVGESAPPARRASWMAIAVSGLLCSLSFGTPLGALIGAAFGWTKVFDLLAGLSLVLVLLNRWTWPAETATVSPAQQKTAAIVLRCLRCRQSSGRLRFTLSIPIWGPGSPISASPPRRLPSRILCYGIGAIAGTFGGRPAGRPHGRQDGGDGQPPRSFSRRLRCCRWCCGPGSCWLSVLASPQRWRKCSSQLSRPGSSLIFRRGAPRCCQFHNCAGVSSASRWARCSPGASW